MPFSWKNKTRRNRFSQFVADHFQLPKRRRSMVVETGFPTSLIHLYVRHRHGKYGKSSDKKQKANDSTTYSSSGSLSSDLDYRPTDAAARDKYSKTEAELSAGVANLNRLSSGSLVDLHSSLSSDSDYRPTDETTNQNGSKTEGELSVGMRKLNPVLVVVLKVLFLVVLVFGTKTFTIAITLFAFLLFFLELMWKRLSGRPVLVRSKQAATVVVCSQVLDEVRSEVLIEIRGKSSRRAMMKSRIKKLVPKKLRIRKASMDSKLEDICCEFKEEETGRRSSSSTLSIETECDDGKSGTNVEWNSDCLVLFLIVLVGLIEGRVFALVIALSWCLLLKLQWRNIKFFIFSS